MIPFIQDFYKMLFDGINRLPPGQINQWFDALLGKLNGQLGGLGAALSQIPATPPPPEYMKTLHEIDRQLFLQFLMSEIKYLRAHRLMRAGPLYQKLAHDRALSQAKQAQISAALLKLMRIQGIDVFQSILNSERGQSLVAYIKMKFQDNDWPMVNSVDDILDNRETAAVRKTLETILEAYSGSLSTSLDFDSRSAWEDLKLRLGQLTSTHAARIQALKRLWAATGGGGINSNQAGFQAIKSYYEKLYQQIEAGGGGSLVIMMTQIGGVFGS